MHLDPLMPNLVGALLAILLIGLMLRAIKQPYVIGYLIAGIILGPHILAIVEDEATLTRLGAIGVVLLLFFIGMEVSPQKLIANWKIAVIGTLLQILISVGLVWPLGTIMDWPLERIILIGFVISLSSTAVVLKLLQDWKEFETPVGQSVLAILLAQDLAIIPMLIILSSLGSDSGEHSNLFLQLGGTVIIVIIVALIAIKGSIHLPLSKLLGDDHELQIFAALFICLGLSLLTALAGLSTALGAFVAGMIIGAARETRWVHHSLEPFRIVFIALFFVSIGMLVDLAFIQTNWLQVATLVFLVVISNTFINAITLKLLGSNWHDSLYAGSLLSQIGEFSFILAAVGIQAQIITDFGYQLTIAVISISLLLSPAWIMLVKMILQRSKSGKN